MALAAARARARLADRSVAQKFPVVRLPRFLDASELRAVDRLAAAHAERHAASGDRPHWRTRYLNSGGLMRRAEPALLDKLVGAAKRVDAETFGGRAGAARARCVELHVCGEGAALADPAHYDSGSIVTLDVMLDEADAGGRFATLEASGEHLEHLFERGDAVVFPSYKYHSVTPVERGERRALVLELWDGDEKFCDHRCGVARGDCEALALGRRLPQKPEAPFSP